MQQPSELPIAPDGYSIFQLPIDENVNKIIQTWVPLQRCIQIEGIDGVNCVPSSLALAGLIDRFEAQLWGLNIEELVHEYGLRHNFQGFFRGPFAQMDKITKSECRESILLNIKDSMRLFAERLLPGHITIIIVRKLNLIGHFLNIVKLNNGDVFILDGSNGHNDMYPIDGLLAQNYLYFQYFVAHKYKKRTLKLSNISELTITKKKKISPLNKRANLNPTPPKTPFVPNTSIGFNIGKQTKTKKTKKTKMKQMKTKEMKMKKMKMNETKKNTKTKSNE